MCIFGKLIKPVIFSALLTLMLTGCQGTAGGIKVDWGGDRPRHVQDQNMPPAHAPAHGRRAQQRYRYHYYPDTAVYFDTGRGVYFYLADGGWQVSVNLPHRLRVRLGEHVSIEMDSDKPYSKHANHREKYPPGQLKKKNKNKKFGYKNWDD
jgi:hypothetical protein